MEFNSGFKGLMLVFYIGLKTYIVPQPKRKQSEHLRTYAYSTDQFVSDYSPCCE